jgi:hypothetical protein
MGISFQDENISPEHMERHQCYALLLRQPRRIKVPLLNLSFVPFLTVIPKMGAAKSTVKIWFPILKRDHNRLIEVSAVAVF